VPGAHSAVRLWADGGHAYVSWQRYNVRTSLGTDTSHASSGVFILLTCASRGGVDKLPPFARCSREWLDVVLRSPPDASVYVIRTGVSVSCAYEHPS
jgi:hypothetical protein